MSRKRNVGLPVVLLLSALAMSACATKPKEVAAEPAPVAVAAEQTTAPEPAAAAVAEQATPAPVTAAEQEAPKPVVKKHRKARKKVAKVAPAPVATPAPVAAPAPAPAVQQEAPPAPTPVTVAPIEKPAEPGFLEKYWLWLLGIVVIVIAFLALRKKE